MRGWLPILVLMLSGLLTVLPAAADGTTLTKFAEAAGMEAYAVPLKAPAFALPSLDGETRDKHGYRGRVVLLNFWASWCPPCREEFPSLQRLQQVMGGRDFTVLAIAVADNEAAVTRFLEGQRPGFDVLLDNDRKTAGDYRAAGVPVTYLLDREGRLLAGKTGPQHWDSPQVRRLIQETIHPRKE
ncbi:MAG: TlpA disulfide reductase family protein [Thiobacillus sp.]|nr:TlpA disulfide reductase family protein [Thiobacillus sp.]